MPSGLGERKINRENRAFAGDGGNLNIAILSGQDFAGKIQTDADAAFILYLTGAVEALEYFRKFLLVYADAGIRDIDPCKQLIGVNGDSNAAGGGIFRRQSRKAPWLWRQVCTAPEAGKAWA